MLWRERTNSMVAAVTGPRLTVDFTHTSSVLGLRARSELRVVSCVEGMWKKREAFKKDLSTRRAFHLAPARFSARWSMSLLLTNLLSDPELFNKSWTDGSVRFSWFPAKAGIWDTHHTHHKVTPRQPGMQGGFYHKVFLSNFQWNSGVLCSCYC